MTFDKPVFIIGAPRSGTSILGLLLSASPNIVYVNEPRLIWRYGNDRRSDVLSADRATEKVTKHIRRKFNALLSDSDSRLLEKSPSNGLRMPFVHKVFPEALFVHIVRDGFKSSLSIRDYWESNATGAAPKRQVGGSSILRQRLAEAHWSQWPAYAGELFKRYLPHQFAKNQLWGPRLPGLDEWAGNVPTLLVAALQWRFCVEMACQYGRGLPEDQYYEVRLEDFNEEVLKEIALFAKIPWSTELQSAFAHHFNEDQQKKRVVTDNTVDYEFLDPWVSPTMDYLNRRNI